MKLFTKTVSGLRVEQHSVYRTFKRGFLSKKDDFPFPENYLEELRKAVESSISPEQWELVRRENKTNDPEYVSYTEEVRDHFIQEFGLEERKEEVKIGLYHADMFVISFPAEKNTDYPYYYMGIQLKPFEEN